MASRQPDSGPMNRNLPGMPDRSPEGQPGRHSDIFQNALAGLP